MTTKADASFLVDLAVEHGVVRDTPALRAAQDADPIGLATAIIVRGASYVVEKAREKEERDATANAGPRLPGFGRASRRPADNLNRGTDLRENGDTLRENGEK